MYEWYYLVFNWCCCWILYMERWKRLLIDLYWLIRFWIIIKGLDDSEDVE
mgnify:FL=1